LAGCILLHYQPLTSEGNIIFDLHLFDLSLFSGMQLGHKTSLGVYEVFKQQVPFYTRRECAENMCLLKII
jgi:hypothetical protein